MPDSSKTASRRSSKRRPEAARTAGPRIVEIAGRLGRRIPAGERRSIPKDLSGQIDHYVYGTPKR